MYCKNYYNCANCQKLIKSTSIELVESCLVITIPEFEFENLEQYCLVLCQSIPSDATTERVTITDGETSYTTVLTRYGNFVRADMLRTRRRYVIAYGNDTEHISIMCGLCPTAYVVGG